MAALGSISPPMPPRFITLIFLTPLALASLTFLVLLGCHQARSCGAYRQRRHANQGSVCCPYLVLGSSKCWSEGRVGGRRHQKECLNPNARNLVQEFHKFASDGMKIRSRKVPPKIPSIALPFFHHPSSPLESSPAPGGS